jgi:hypothetical protein
MPLQTLWKSAATAAATLALAALATPAQAQQMYKCAQPDGKTAFQDQPCHMSGSTGGTVSVKVTPPSSDAPPPGAAPQPPQRQRSTSPYAGTQTTADAQNAQKQRQQQQQQQQQQDEFQRSARCNNARSNLGALKAQRPVFQYDNKGEKQYLDDSKRQSEMAAAQRGVAENCR